MRLSRRQNILLYLLPSLLLGGYWLVRYVDYRWNFIRPIDHTIREAKILPNGTPTKDWLATAERWATDQCPMNHGLRHDHVLAQTFPCQELLGAEETYCDRHVAFLRLHKEQEENRSRTFFTNDAQHWADLLPYTHLAGLRKFGYFQEFWSGRIGFPTLVALLAYAGIIISRLFRRSKATTQATP